MTHSITSLIRQAKGQLSGIQRRSPPLPWQAVEAKGKGQHKVSGRLWKWLKLSETWIIHNHPDITFYYLATVHFMIVLYQSIRLIWIALQLLTSAGLEAKTWDTVLLPCSGLSHLMYPLRWLFNHGTSGPLGPGAGSRSAQDSEKARELSVVQCKATNKATNFMKWQGM